MFGKFNWEIENYIVFFLVFGIGLSCFMFIFGLIRRLGVNDFSFKV